VRPSALAVCESPQGGQRSERLAEQPRKSAGVIKQTADADVFIETMLIVVVINERHDHKGNLKRIHERALRSEPCRPSCGCARLPSSVPVNIRSVSTGRHRLRCC
jgi:hypothetical protein